MQNENYKSVKTILWVILFANIFVSAIKLCIGFVCGSQSVIADGIHSFADGASNVVGLTEIWLASKPKDAKHPYGHGKFEVLASLFIGFMLAVMSLKILSRAVLSFINPSKLHLNLAEALLMGLTIVINTIVAVTEYRSGKRLDSTILVTDSLHTRGDIMISTVVLIGLIGIKSGMPIWIDGIMSSLVAVAVLASALQIIKSCTEILVDSKAVDEDDVKRLLMSVPGVYDVHKIRSRGEFSHLFIELHIIVNPQDNVIHSHELSHGLEAILKEHYGFDTEVNIHVEPNDGLHGI